MNVKRRRRRAPTNPIQRANRKPDDEFVKDHLQPPSAGDGEWKDTWTHPSSGEVYHLGLVGARSMVEADLGACLDLIELTSGDDYRNSSIGWNRDKKLKEMKSVEMRYILVKAAATGAVAAFTSFMPTYEEGQPVVYCYEVHMHKELQRSGMGSLLMGHLCAVATNLPPIEKVMLTCFVANVGGLAFYAKTGFSKDEISPEPRRLRNGQTRDPDYVILSKVVTRRSSAVSQPEAVRGADAE